MADATVTTGHERRLDLIPLIHSRARENRPCIDQESKASMHYITSVYMCMIVQLLKRIRTPGLPSIILIIMPTIQI